VLQLERRDMRICPVYNYDRYWNLDYDCHWNLNYDRYCNLNNNDPGRLLKL
jgi:hypothetical protein